MQAIHVREHCCGSRLIRKMKSFSLRIRVECTPYRRYCLKLEIEDDAEATLGDVRREIISKEAANQLQP